MSPIGRREVLPLKAESSLAETHLAKPGTQPESQILVGDVMPLCWSLVPFGSTGASRSQYCLTTADALAEVSAATARDDSFKSDVQSSSAAPQHLCSIFLPLAGIQHERQRTLSIGSSESTGFLSSRANGSIASAKSINCASLTMDESISQECVASSPAIGVDCDVANPSLEVWHMWLDEIEADAQRDRLRSSGTARGQRRNHPQQLSSRPRNQGSQTAEIRSLSEIDSCQDPVVLDVGCQTPPPMMCLGAAPETPMSYRLGPKSWPCEGCASSNDGSQDLDGTSDTFRALLESDFPCDADGAVGEGGSSDPLGVYVVRSCAIVTAGVKPCPEEEICEMQPGTRVTVVEVLHRTDLQLVIGRLQDPLGYTALHDSSTGFDGLVLAIPVSKEENGFGDSICKRDSRAHTHIRCRSDPAVVWFNEQ